MARARALGWHVRLHMDGPDLLDYADVLETLHDIPVVIDHMGRIDLAQGLAQPAMRWILSMLARDNWWMMVSNGNITGLVERLVESGHLARWPLPTDRRVQVVALTEAGREEFTRMARSHEDWIAQMFAGLSPAEVDRLLSLLRKLKLSVHAVTQADA